MYIALLIDVSNIVIVIKTALDNVIGLVMMLGFASISCLCVGKCYISYCFIELCKNPVYFLYCAISGQSRLKSLVISVTHNVFGSAISNAKHDESQTNKCNK